MGIRFRCPNGHKLNVKDFLAGKRGICPKCGVKLRIPAESDPQLVPVEGTPSQARRMPERDESNSTPAEVAQEVWYLRPPGGDQLGPVTPSVFQQWIVEGRVTDDSYVWRPGWEDWKLARVAIPNLPVTAPASRSEIVINDAMSRGPDEISGDTPSLGLPSIVVATNSGGTRTELYRKRKSNKMVTLMIVILLFGCAILFAALVYVVR